jgi:hypothetical protein
MDNPSFGLTSTASVPATTGAQEVELAGPLEILTALEKQVWDLSLLPCSPVEIRLANALGVVIAVLQHEIAKAEGRS